MDVCRVQISNGRWWSFILIVYRDGWKVWGWCRVDICLLYGPWLFGSRIWPLLPTLIWGANSNLMASSDSFHPISSLGQMLYGIWRACAPFRIVLGGFPCQPWCFPPMKEACLTNIGLRIRKHSRMSTKASQWVEYWRHIVISIIYEPGTHFMYPKYANLQVEQWYYTISGDFQGGYSCFTAIFAN